jgi:WhiB family transcriptional regulator, redox-sensing transcriptional regulator
MRPWHTDSWRQKAACADVDPNLFFPRGQGSIPSEGLRVCTGIHPTHTTDPCPVRADCLLEAIGHIGYEDTGIWGGTTADAREEVRQNRMTVARATALGNRLAGSMTAEEQAAAHAARMGR